MTFREIDLAIRAYQERIAKLADIHGALTEVVVGAWVRRPPKLTRRGNHRERVELGGNQVTFRDAAEVLDQKKRVKRSREQKNFEKSVEGTKTEELMQAYATED